MSRLKSQLAIIFVIGLPVVLVAALFGPTVFDLAVHRRAPERYLIPNGFTGWVRIDYQQKGAPSLPSENGHRLLKLNPQGAAATSSNAPSGHGADDFFSYSTDAEHRVPLSNAGVCKDGMIWGLQTMIDSRTSMPFTRFFVGTEEQYRREVDPLAKILPNCN